MKKFRYKLTLVITEVREEGERQHAVETPNVEMNAHNPKQELKKMFAELLKEVLQAKHWSK